MDIAKDIFAKGDRVQFVDNVLMPQFPKWQGKLGTVVGFSRNGTGVRVRLDGMKTAYSWAALFWRTLRRADVP